MRSLVLCLALIAPGAATQPTFTNPILRPSAGDPTVLRHDGHYYLAATLREQDGIYLFKSKSLTDFNTAEKRKIWSAPTTGPASKELWAPELYRFGDRFYLYFTALGAEGYHRHYVLRSVTDNPDGEWTFEGDVDPEFKAFALDGAVLIVDDKLFWLYAGDRKERGLNIAPMESPLRVAPNASRVTFTTGDQPWEAAWWRKDGQWVKGDFGWIEAPQPLYHAGRTFVVYSAGHTGTPHYALGLLELRGDPMVKSSWHKTKSPVFAPTPQTVTVGHNSFTLSPDGKEHWILYHARDVEPDNPWDRKSPRTLRAQRFTFDSQGLPSFGNPEPTSRPLAKPSGEN